MNRENIVQILTKSLNGNYVEIGTDSGNFAEFILKNTPCQKLYCIDPWQKYDDYKDAINNVTGNELYEKVKNRLKIYGDRVEIIREFSLKGSSKVPDELDFVYIDGNHSYKYVMEDLRTWYPKVRTGGIIIGDDCVDLDDSKRDNEGDVRIDWGYNCFGYYGVYKAIRDFSREMGLKFEVVGNQFIIVK